MTISIDKNISSLVFCRFGDKELQGKKIDDFTLTCVTPRIQYSEVLLSVSEDKSKWSLPVTVSVIPESNSSVVSFLLIIGFVIVGISLASRSIFGKKKRKTHKKRRVKKEVLDEPFDGKKRTKKRKQNTNMI